MILAGNCLDHMRAMEEGSVQCVVTSPPYFALRDYRTTPLAWPATQYSTLGGIVSVAPMSCQLGLEENPNDFIGHMVDVFREVRRVLAKDGVCWVNIGDSYASGGGTGEQGGRGQRFLRRHTQETLGESRKWPEHGIKPKDMIGIPWMLAFALRNDGWFLRQDVIWSKPNPMPESAKDRCTKSHEYLFMLTRSQRYYFDAMAIKEPASRNTHPRVARRGIGGWAAGPGDHSTIDHSAPDRKSHHHAVQRTNGVGFGHGFDANPKPRVTRLQDPNQRPADIRHRDSYRRDNTGGRQTLFEAEPRSKVAHQVDAATSARMGRAPGWRAGVTSKTDQAEAGTRNNPSFAEATSGSVLESRNKRSVWTIPTQPFKGAHFATFPEALVRPCILSSTKAGQRVYDPFGGSATVGAVAKELARDWIVSELKQEYRDLGEERTRAKNDGLAL